MPKNLIAALIIAAGYSSRMHAFKPLLPVGNVSALKRLIQTYQAFGIGHIYVVVGHRGDEIEAALKGDAVRIVYNEAYDQGMFSSIQKGLRAIDASIEAFYMHPVDIPLVKVSSLEWVYEAYKRTHKGVIYPTFLGRKGHPPLVSMTYKAQILSSAGEGGLKKVLEQFSEDALHVNVCDQSVLMDMDTKEDYERLLGYEAHPSPNEEECRAMMVEKDVLEPIIKHCWAVEAMVCLLYALLDASRVEIDMHVLRAAAWVHDIARLEKNHALVGAEHLRALGYPRVGDLIATHMDIEVNPTAPLSANELLFLADKLVDEEDQCGFEKRFKRAFEKCQGNLEATRNIAKRLEAVRAIVGKIEHLTCKDFPYG